MAVRFKLESYKHPHFIREWRKHRRMSQDRLVAETGISKTTISRLENYGQPYSQDLLEAIAEALDCGPADLLNQDPAELDGSWDMWRALSKANQKQAIRLLRALVQEHDEEAA